MLHLDKFKAAPNARRLIEKLSGYFPTLKRNTIFRLFVVWLTAYVVLLSYLFTSVLSGNSYVEIHPTELILPLIMHAITASIVSLIIYRQPWLRSYFSKIVSVAVLTLLLVDYDRKLSSFSPMIKALVPGLSADDPLWIASLFYLTILTILAVCIGITTDKIVSRSKFKSSDIQYGLFIVIGYLFLTPAFTMAQIIPAMARESYTRPESLPSAKAVLSASDDKPDIYYIVLDRYTNANVLRSQFGFDNSPFTGFLRDNGFTVRDDAKSNYPFTTMSIASTMNAGYTDKQVAPFKDEKVQSQMLFHNLIWQSSVANALKQNDYQYHVLGSWYGATYKAPQADIEHTHSTVLHMFGKRMILRGIEAAAVSSSPYYQFAQINSGWWPFKVATLEPIALAKDQLNKLQTLSSVDKPGGRFIFAHILVPHDPFNFNADGSLATDPSADNVGRPIKQKYTDQVQFINHHMQDIISTIITKSGNKSVIVLQSDEGPYPHVMNSKFLNPLQSTEQNTNSQNQRADSTTHGLDMRQWDNDWLEMKYGILQAAHIPRATENDLANLSSVNIFRIVLNRYAGQSLPYLPECHYGLADTNRPYVLFDLTNKLSASPSPDCPR